MLQVAEGLLLNTVAWARLIIECIGAGVVAIGAASALYGFVLGLVRHQVDQFHRTRLGFARYLVLGLEFQLAADILSTAVAPTWESIGKLAAIAVVRTALNFFLMREMQEAEARVREEAPAR